MQPSAALSSGLLLLPMVLGSSLVRAQNDTLGMISKAFDKCNDDPDLYSCLKAKAVKLLDRALALNSLPITDYVTLVRDSSSSGEPAPQTSLPRDLGDLDLMLADRLSQYLRTRTVQLTMPKDLFEGRGKGYKGSKGGKGGIFLVFGAFAAMLLQLALGKLALIAGKALLVGKVALLLTGIIGLKSLVSSGHGEVHSPQVVYAEPEHHGSWGRSMGEGGDLAYRGHKTKPTKKTDQL